MRVGKDAAFGSEAQTPGAKAEAAQKRKDTVGKVTQKAKPPAKSGVKKRRGDADERKRG